MNSFSHQQRARKQQGVALIMAILIVALATILAVNVATDGYMDQRRSGTVLLVDQAYEAGLGAEALAAEALLVHEQGNGPKEDSLNQAWAQEVTLPMDEGIGEVTGHLEDLQGRFNLNSLINPNGNENAEAKVQFGSLLTRVGVDTKWVGIVADWIDADNIPDPLGGAEDSIYSSQLPPYLTANMPITRTSELLAMVDSSGKSFGLDNYRLLEPFITALPIDTQLNICTAPPEVLDSLAPTMDEYTTASGRANLIENRKSACFPKITDINRSFGNNLDKAFGELTSKHPGYLVDISSYFRANILVSIGTTELAMYSVLQRNSGGKVHTILRSFGTP